MIRFLLMINKQGQTRLSKYYVQKDNHEKVALEAELIRKCLCRQEGQSSILHIRENKIVYRRYASLFIIIGATEDENELGLLEFIQNLVETLDKYYDSVCELDIMYNLERTHYIINEMIINGCIVDTNRSNALYPLFLHDNASKF
ncbi:bifunctional Adaptor protein complex [Babesia duncani]|uniref:AP complex subunit sigma n=1 Tax=Babesia duncani TaxID=323732 RepID=A0AAD9PJ76_9APIC|nr:bifunctional Adaptor protein complex [Babesia duncani]